MKHYKKTSPVMRAEVTSKILAAIERNENKPPHQVRDLLHLDEVQRFIRPDTRGPQEPALPPRLLDPLPLAEVPDQTRVAVIAILFLIVFIAGVVVGRLL